MKRFRFLIALLLAVSTMVVLPSCEVLLQGLSDNNSSNNTNNNNTNNNSGGRSSGTSTGSSTSKARH